MAIGKLGRRGGFGSGGTLGRAGVPAGPVTIGGVAVGTAGTGALSGFTMVGGNDFASALSSQLVTPFNLTGKIAHNYSERDRRRTSTTSVFSLADQYWSGDQDVGDGVFTSSFSDVLSQSSSVLAMKARRASTAEKALLGVRDQTAAAITYVNAGDSNGVNSLRPMVAAEVTLAHDFAYTGNRVVEVRWRYTPGATIGGTGNPGNAIWELNARGGSEQGDNAGAEYNDETDWTELHISGGNSVTRYASGLSSGGNPSPLNNGTWQVMRATVTNGIFKIDTLNDTTGAVIGTVSMTYSSQNNSQLWYMMLGQVVTTTGFDENQWVGKEALYEVDFVRVWTPSSSILTPQVSNDVVVLDFNGSGSLVLPSQATLWGTAVDSEQITPMYAYGSNGPGRAADQTSPLQTRDALPTGVTWNSGTRTLSFANTFTTQAGFVNLLVYPKTAGIGFVRPHVVTVIVKPKLAIPTPTAAVPGSAWTWTVPRGSRNWDNGNLPLGTGDGLSVVSMPAWVTYDAPSKTFSGTAPSPLTDTQFVFRCTNGAGYTTDQTTNVAVFAPSALTGLAYAWDTTDTTNTPDDGSGKVAQMFHLYDNTKYLGRTTAANRPVLSASGGPSSNKRVVTFASASSQLLRSSEGSGLTALAQLLNGVNVQTPIGYVAFAAKANSAAITNRFVQFTSADGTMFYSLRQTSTTRGLSYQSSGQATVAVTDAAPDANWHVFELIKNGSTITLTVDGAQIATGAIAQTAAFTAADFIIGGTSAGAGVATAAFDGAFGPGIVASAIPSTGDRSFSRQWIANKMGITTA